MKCQPTSTCSAESEDLLLPLNGLDSKPLDSATTNHTPKQFSKSIGLKFQSTMTSKHSMARHIEESLFSQEDFPASRSVVPGSKEAKTMTAISGRKCFESYKRQGQVGSLVKMLLESSIWNSKKCVLIWRRVVTKSSRSLFQLAVSMPRIEEAAYGLLQGGGGGDVADSLCFRNEGLREQVDNTCETLEGRKNTEIYGIPSFERDPADCESLSKSFLGRVADGIPDRTHRLKGLGNAIVPQVAYQIIKGIRELL